MISVRNVEFPPFIGGLKHFKAMANLTLSQHVLVTNTHFIVSLYIKTGCKNFLELPFDIKSHNCSLFSTLSCVFVMIGSSVSAESGSVVPHNGFM